MDDATFVFDQGGIPLDYASSLEDIAPNITSLIAQTGTESRSWYDTLASIIPNLTATYEQKQLLDAQIERARLGLPPIDSTGANQGLSKDTQQLLMYAAIGGGLFLWYLSTRRRR